MPTEILSVSQYAEKKNKTRQAILKAIKVCNINKQKKQRLLPGVADYKKIGNSYILTVAV